MYPDPNVGPLWEFPKRKPYIYSGYLWGYDRTLLGLYPFKSSELNIPTELKLLTIAQPPVDPGLFVGI